ncbi:MAG: HPF/RaiA family ribosome-associated protein [Myxococcota bacterium]|nr:HPF/RaiA family ribosome-associated protein [Myxococcota bacterium]
MKIPLQITYRGVSSSDALSHVIREEADKLEEFYDKITSCRVVVDQPHKHHRKGKHFLVRVDLTVPGNELVAGKEENDDDSHEDPFVAVAESFRAVRRMLQEHVQKRRGDVKRHGSPVLGTGEGSDEGEGEAVA